MFALRMAITLVMALAGLAALGILAWIGTQSIAQFLFFRNEIFRLRSVKIECDGEVITPKHVSEYLILNTCSNLFSFNMAAERAALLKKVPRIRNVEFTRTLPGKLAIVVRERLPMARLGMGYYYLAVDREGKILGPSSGSKNLPVISRHKLSGLRPGVLLEDMKIARALKVLTTCDTTPVGEQIKIREIDVAQEDALELTLAGGEKVLFAWPDMDRDAPGNNLERKLIRLAESLKSAAARGKKIAAIDMTLENNFPAREY